MYNNPALICTLQSHLIDIKYFYFLFFGSPEKNEINELRDNGPSPHPKRSHENFRCILFDNLLLVQPFPSLLLLRTATNVKPSVTKCRMKMEKKQENDGIINHCHHITTLHVSIFQYFDFHDARIAQ